MPVTAGFVGPTHAELNNQSIAGLGGALDSYAQGKRQDRQLGQVDTQLAQEAKRIKTEEDKLALDKLKFGEEQAQNQRQAYIDILKQVQEAAKLAGTSVNALALSNFGYIQKLYADAKLPVPSDPAAWTKTVVSAAQQNNDGEALYLMGAIEAEQKRLVQEGSGQMTPKFVARAMYGSGDVPSATTPELAAKGAAKLVPVGPAQAEPASPEVKPGAVIEPASRKTMEFMSADEAIAYAAQNGLSDTYEVKGDLSLKNGQYKLVNRKDGTEYMIDMPEVRKPGGFDNASATAMAIDDRRWGVFDRWRHPLADKFGNPITYGTREEALKAETETKGATQPPQPKVVQVDDTAEGYRKWLLEFQTSHTLPSTWQNVAAKGTTDLRSDGGLYRQFRAGISARDATLDGDAPRVNSGTSQAAPSQPTGMTTTVSQTTSEGGTPAESGLTEVVRKREYISRMNSLTADLRRGIMGARQTTYKVGKGYESQANDPYMVAMLKSMNKREEISPGSVDASIAATADAPARAAAKEYADIKESLARGDYYSASAKNLAAQTQKLLEKIAQNPDYMGVIKQIGEMPEAKLFQTGLEELYKKYKGDVSNPKLQEEEKSFTIQFRKSHPDFASWADFAALAGSAVTGYTPAVESLKTDARYILFFQTQAAQTIDRVVMNGAALPGMTSSGSGVSGGGTIGTAENDFLSKRGYK